MSAPWTKAGCSDWLEMWAPKLKPHGIFKVAFIISRHADDETGECDISIKTIAEMCGMAPSDVRNAVKRLAEIGCMHVEPGSQGAGHCGFYRLLAEPGEVQAHKDGLKAKRKAKREEYARARMASSVEKYTGNGAHIPDAPPIHVTSKDAVDNLYQRLFEQEQRAFEASRVTAGSS
jgi:hypothetical protein